MSAITTESTADASVLSPVDGSATSDFIRYSAQSFAAASVLPDAVKARRSAALTACKKQTMSPRIGLTRYIYIYIYIYI